MPRNLALAIVLLIASSFFWSGNFFSGKVAFLTNLTPFKLSFFRWILALLILLPFTYKQIIIDLDYYRKNIFLMIIISILGVTFFNSFTYISLRSSMVINSTLMASIAPVMMIGFSWLLFRTKTTKLQFAGIILSLIGAFSIILKGNLDNLYNLSFTSGDLWMIAAVISWCLYSVLLKKIDSKTSQLANLEVMIIIGIIFITPFYIFESVNSTFLPSSQLDFVIISYVAVFASIVAFFSWNKGVSIIGPNRASLFLHLIPVFSAVWAITFLDEKFAFFHIIGVIFILSGIILSNVK
ncbi:DMT family transporter [Pelagibacteraceae bacterium]|nr:DMT family transporter [Pelagibacteraceae bacterium]